jgi:hypoxanthine phosphoribosyltransferase
MENLQNKYYYEYKQFLKHIKLIVDWLKPQTTGYTKYGIEPWDPDLIVSVNRGGLVPGVYLSHALKVPHLPIHYQTRDSAQANHSKGEWKFSFKPYAFHYDKKILLVDDINDSGKTLKTIMSHWEKNNLGDAPITKRVKIVSLIERKGSKFTVDYSPLTLDTKEWVVFPWEGPF